MSRGHTNQFDRDRDGCVGESHVLPSHIEQILRKLPEQEALRWRTLYDELAALRSELATTSPAIFADSPRASG